MKYDVKAYRQLIETCQILTARESMLLGSQLPGAEKAFNACRAKLWEAREALQDFRTANGIRD